MAQSMLAALGASRPGASLASAPAAQGDRLHSANMHLRASGPAVVKAPRAAAGQELAEEQHDSGSKVAEVHWEPAVQLPSLQAADGGRREEILRKAEPLPAGQVWGTNTLSEVSHQGAALSNSHRFLMKESFLWNGGVCLCWKVICHRQGLYRWAAFILWAAWPEHFPHGRAAV